MSGRLVVTKKVGNNYYFSQQAVDDFLEKNKELYQTTKEGKE